ncbi:MAG: phosphate-starvation-inducible PsiE family protein [Microcystaceae cyanobacterium]
MGKWLNKLRQQFDDETFLDSLHGFEKLVAKILSLTLITVIVISIIDLLKIMVEELTSEPVGFFTKSLIGFFGLILNVLIALELLENITGYLKKNVIQVELVIVTAIIAVARKVIIFDFDKYSSNNLALFSLGFVTVCLAFSYWLIKRTNPGRE